jgi:hypothetical protein
LTIDGAHNVEVLNKAHFAGRVIHNPQNIPLPKNANEVLFYKLDIYWNLEEVLYAFKQHNLDPKSNPLSKFKQTYLLMYLVHLVGDAQEVCFEDCVLLYQQNELCLILQHYAYCLTS